MNDKFRVNSQIVMPVAVLVLVIYFFMGSDVTAPTDLPPVRFFKIVPYLLVLVCAVCGMNVLAVLAIGLLFTGIIGIADGSYDLFGWFASMGHGIVGMGELIIITMMAGGLLEVIYRNGGIAYLIRLLTSRVHGKRGAELSIAALVSLVDVCTANNTVAIITVGEITKRICEKFKLDSRKCASILDIFSCCVQGLIPYGAQLLMAAGLASLNPVSIIPYLYYPFAIGIAGLLSILFRYPRKYS